MTELDELALAYAVTIHKSQGSEYPIVVMPFTMSHFVMLQRNLLYTGVTRAKKILVLVGEKKAVYYAIKNETTTGRNTCLARRLQPDSKEAQEVKAQLLKEAVDETANENGSDSKKMIVYKAASSLLWYVRHRQFMREISGNVCRSQSSEAVFP